MKSKSTLKLIGILSLIILCSVSCQNNKEKQTEQLKNKPFNIEAKSSPEIDANNKIIITGKSDDSLAFNYLNLLNFSKYSSQNSFNKKEVVGDSMHLEMGEVNTPQLIDLIAFSDREDKQGYLSRVFLTPGDSIYMEVRNGDIQFSGKNAAHYNFFLKMNDPLRQKWAVYENDPYTYKNELFEAYKSKDSLLQSYIKENPEVSEDFKKLVGAELKFEYLYNLMLPINVEDKNFKGTYRNNGNTIAYLSQVNNNSETLFDFKIYFDGITIDDFNKPELINNDYFKRSLVLYIRHYLSNQEYIEYSRSNFIKEKEYIEDNLEGQLETFAIGKLIDNYYSKGFGHGQQDTLILKGLIKEYAGRFTEESFAEKMNDILEDLEAIDFILPENILDEKLLTLKGDTIKLKQILAANKTKVIDYWASWCGPCISEFDKAKDFKKRIQKKENLEYIYISIDDDESEWRQKIMDLSNLLTTKNQYLILNRKKSRLLKKMLLREYGNEITFTIPRYCILDSKNKIISNNSPRPSDSLAFEKIITDIKP